MSEEREGMHQLHINIPIEIYEELKTMMPERGMITGLVRNFLRLYVVEVKRMHTTGVINDPTHKSIQGIVSNQVKKGVIGSGGESNGST